MRLSSSLLMLLSLICFQVSAEESALQVDVNTATAEEIQYVLSGVGEKKAQAIIDYREAHGEFQSPYDLMLVNGIGKKTVEKNIDKMVFSRPEPTPETTNPDPVQPEERVHTPEPAATPTADAAITEQPIPNTPDSQNTISDQQDVEPNFTDAQITPESLKSEQPAETN